jgi:hypothetical protein
MTKKEIIIEYLTANKHKYCDDCIEDVCDVHPRQQVNQICNGLTPRVIETSRDICFICGKTKTTRSINEGFNRSVPRDENIKEQMISMDRLQHVGFQKSGCWALKSGMIDFELKENIAGYSNVLYAFIVNDSVKYVGKSTMTLKQRMQQYKTPGPTQSTNTKNNANIMKELEAGKSVEIYAFIDSGLFSDGGFRLNLAEGLETSIIEDLRPEWNEK